MKPIYGIFLIRWFIETENKTQNKRFNWTNKNWIEKENEISTPWIVQKKIQKIYPKKERSQRIAITAFITYYLAKVRMAHSNRMAF